MSEFVEFTDSHGLRLHVSAAHVAMFEANGCGGTEHAIIWLAEPGGQSLGAVHVACSASEAVRRIGLARTQMQRGLRILSGGAD